MRSTIPALALVAAALALVACTPQGDELADRCQRADSVVTTYESRIDPPVELENAWMVESQDPTLEAWYFISAVVHGGDFDGSVATWQFPGFGPTAGIDLVNTPNLSVPANSVATSLDIGSVLSLEPTEYGVTNWAELEGFQVSQRCVERDRP